MTGNVGDVGVARLGARLVSRVRRPAFGGRDPIRIVGAAVVCAALLARAATSSAAFRGAVSRGRVRAVLVTLVVSLGLVVVATPANAFVYWTNNSSGTIGRANLDGTGVNQSFITGAYLVPGSRALATIRCCRRSAQPRDDLAPQTSRLPLFAVMRVPE